MKITLIARKIALGLLMTLVMAISGQSQQEDIQVPRAVSGLPNGTEILTIIAPENAFLRVGSPEDTFPFENSSILTQSGTIYRSTLTLPRETGTYSLSVFIEERRYSVTVSVTADPVETGVLTVRVDPFSGVSGTIATVTVTATDSDNQPAEVTVILTATGGTLATSTLTTGINGIGTVTLTRGTTVGHENYVVASAPNYDLVSGRFLISEVPPEPPPPAGEAHALAIQDGNDQKGALNTPLEEPFVVKVVDAYSNPVKDVRVRFRVTRGRGSFSSRRSRTDKNGLAETTFTPISTGHLRAVATVPGVDDTVTFYIGVQKVSVSPITEAKVFVAAANRPPMIWVNGGAIYTLVGTSIQRFAPSVDTAIDIAIGDNTVYWTEKTSETHGTLNAANLDGTGVRELRSLWGVPIGIAVDPDRSKLYWTDTVGRLQRANLDGTGIRNVLRDLPEPMDIAVAGDTVYWTQGAPGSVRFVNLTGPKNVRTVSTGMDTVGGLAIGSNTVYWTEKTSETHGTLNAANLDGTGVRELRSLWGVPIGIAVDPDRSKLYWTDAVGRLQRANLDSTGIQNVTKGLGNPSAIVLSNSLKAPKTETLTTSTTHIATETRPEQAQLLANYPNPFNPETWIPYELATDTDVRLTIYNAQGVVIRTLQLGQQSAGYYRDRERAAYWDGRNALGEQVASGIYFYRLETDTVSSMRKMIILK